MANSDKKWEQLPEEEQCLMGSTVYNEGVAGVQIEREEGQICAAMHRKGEVCMVE
jgi:hypothetical protein